MSKITNMRKVKQDDKFSIAVREIQSGNAANKKCFDCDQRGPTYVNMTIGSFVCTKCSGMLRGINPPHRIKSISMSSFTSEEVEMLRSKGNAWCAAVWTGNYNKNTNPVDFKDDEKVKEFIVSKYEKKRYYIDPSQANLSSIKQQLTGGSTGSADSQGSHKLQSSSLIGSTLRSRMDPTSAMSQNNVSNFVVSRPEHVSRPEVTPGHVATNGHINNTPGPVTQPTPAKSVTVPVPTAASAAPSNTDNFANFADFDTAAFDSIPPDPLTNPPAMTMPPMIRKQSTGTVSSAPAPVTNVTTKPAVTAATDKYSALAELDDLFRSTAIDSPAAPAPTAAPPAGIDIGGFFSASSNSAAPAPSAIPNLFMSESQTHNGSPGWVGGAPQPAWGGRAASPAAAAWGGRASPAAGTPGGWGAGNSPAVAAKTTSPMWTPQWGANNGDNNGITDSASKQFGGGLNVPQNTNPFGSSPSNPPLGQAFPDNNNVFAAAPFNSDKPGLNNSGNPWSAGQAAGAGLGAMSPFTSAMTPAHNPNNPFL